MTGACGAGAATSWASWAEAAVIRRPCCARCSCPAGPANRPKGQILPGVGAFQADMSRATTLATALLLATPALAAAEEPVSEPDVEPAVEPEPSYGESLA